MMTTRNSRWALVLAACISATACTHTNRDTTDASATPSTSPIITAQEISDAGLGGNTAYEVVRTLRPHFLIEARANQRDHPMMIAINRGQLRALEEMATIPAQSIAEIRYLSLAEATGRYGLLARGPVLLFTLRTN